MHDQLADDHAADHRAPGTPSARPSGWCPPTRTAAPTRRRRGRAARQVAGPVAGGEVHVGLGAGRRRHGLLAAGAFQRRAPEQQVVAPPCARRTRRTGSGRRAGRVRWSRTVAGHGRGRAGHGSDMAAQGRARHAGAVLKKRDIDSAGWAGMSASWAARGRSTSGTRSPSRRRRSRRGSRATGTCAGTTRSPTGRRSCPYPNVHLSFGEGRADVNGVVQRATRSRCSTASDSVFGVAFRPGASARSSAPRSRRSPTGW